MAVLPHAYGVPLGNAFATAVLCRVVSSRILAPAGWAVWSGLEPSSRTRPLRALREG